MKVLLPALALLLSLLTAGCALQPAGKGADVPALVLVGIYPLDNGPDLVEPSGLTLVNGRLFTVGDKFDRTIFAIEIEPPSARLVPAVEFQPPASEAMDWEGITADEHGNFYLISERMGRMLVVSPDGSSSWATPDLRGSARGLGMFQQMNAGFEGIARLGPDHFLGAAERQARGLVEWRKVGDQWQVAPYLMDSSPYSSHTAFPRVLDFSALDADGGRIFALFRNAHLLVELALTGNGYEEIAAWSYREGELHPDWMYREQRYGQAEGLVVDGEDVYIVIDNNRSGRAANPADRRSLLLHLRFPEADGR